MQVRQKKGFISSMSIRSTDWTLTRPTPQLFEKLFSSCHLSKIDFQMLILKARFRFLAGHRGPRRCLWAHGLLAISCGPPLPPGRRRRVGKLRLSLPPVASRGNDRGAALLGPPADFDAAHDPPALRQGLPEEIEGSPPQEKRSERCGGKAQTTTTATAATNGASSSSSSSTTEPAPAAAKATNGATATAEATIPATTSTTAPSAPAAANATLPATPANAARTAAAKVAPTAATTAVLFAPPTASANDAKTSAWPHSRAHSIGERKD